MPIFLARPAFGEIGKNGSVYVCERKITVSKKIVFGLFIATVLSACSTHRFDYELNKPLVANVGDPLVQWSDSTFAVVSTTLIERELLYSGRTGNVVRLQYRESGMTNGGMMVARQPFYQELTYDLSQSPEITFRDIKLRVDGADSNQIRFVVLKGPSTDEKSKSNNSGS